MIQLVGKGSTINMKTSEYNINIDNDYVELKKLIIKKYHINYTQTIPSELIDKISIEQATDMLSSNVLINFSSYFACSEKTETKTTKEQPIITTEEKTFYTFKTWFDHLKFDYFPQWLLTKFPVEFKSEKFTCQTTIKNVTNINNNIIKLCPHIKMKNENECIQFLA